MKTAVLVLSFVLAAATASPAQSLSATVPDTAIHVVTYLDMIPNQAEAGRPLLVQQTLVARSQQGCRSSELLQENALSNHFILVEAWNNEADLEAYHATSGYRTFRAAIQPDTGSPPNERRAQQITPLKAGNASE